MRRGVHREKAPQAQPAGVRRHRIDQRDVLTTLTGPASAQSLETQGVTDKSVKIGFISALTGVAGPNYKNAAKGCEARVDAQNAKGGVNGRKIDLIAVDDASSGANLTAAQDLVTNRKVFAVVNNSPFDFLSYRFVRDAGIPLIGGGTFGQFHGEKGNENIIPALRQRGVLHRPHLRQRRQGDEATGRHEECIDLVRRESVVDRGRGGHPGLRRSGSRARARAHEHVAGFRDHRRRSRRAQHQELGRRRGLPAPRRQHQPGHHRGTQAEQRADEGEHDGVGLRPGHARLADRADHGQARHRVAGLQARRAQERRGREGVPRQPEEVRRRH